MDFGHFLGKYDELDKLWILGNFFGQVWEVGQIMDFGQFWGKYEKLGK